jgi:hypothetical protein
MLTANGLIILLWQVNDTLILAFDMPTDRGRGSGGKRFVDNLLEFSVQLVRVPPCELQGPCHGRAGPLLSSVFQSRC